MNSVVTTFFFKESFSTSHLNETRINAIFYVRIHKDIHQCTDTKKAYSTDLNKTFSENAWKKPLDFEKRFILLYGEAGVGFISYFKILFTIFDAVSKQQYTFQTLY